MSSAVQSLRWAGAARDGQLLGSTIGHLLNLLILNLPCSLTSKQVNYLFLLFSLYARNRTHSTSNSMGWAYPFFSSFFSFFYFEEDPTNRLLSTSSAYSYRTLFLPKIIPKSSGTLPFPGEGERV
jgi:hypothetical protein